MMPTIRQFEALSQAGSDVNIVGRGDNLAARGGVGAFFAGSRARTEAMNSFINAVAQEYGQEVGNLAANLLAAPRAEGTALKGYMVADVLSACRGEAAKIQTYNRNLTAVSGQEAVNTLCADIAGKLNLPADGDGMAAVKTFLERRVAGVAAGSKEPLNGDSLCRALYASANKELQDLFYFMGVNASARNADMETHKSLFKDLPPLTALELSKALGASDPLNSGMALRSLDAIKAAAGQGNPITRAAVWTGLSGHPAPADLDGMSDADFSQRLSNEVIKPILADTPRLRGMDPQKRDLIVNTILGSALEQGLSLTAALECLQGRRAITLADYTAPQHVRLGAYDLNNLDSTESALGRDLCRRGGVGSFPNNANFNSSITIRQSGGGSFAVNLSNPTLTVPMNESEMNAYKSMRGSPVTKALGEAALQLCGGNRKQAAALVAALGQQSMISCRAAGVPNFLGTLAGARNLGEHSPASVEVRCLDNGDIEVKFQSLEPDRASYSMTCHVKPDGNVPIVGMEIREPNPA
jgi:hypothetical protein